MLTGSGEGIPGPIWNTLHLRRCEISKRECQRARLIMIPEFGAKVLAEDKHLGLLSRVRALKPATVNPASPQRALCTGLVA